MSEKRSKKRAAPRFLMPLLLAMALILAAAAPSFLSVLAAPRKLPVYSVQRDDKCVSLTFDAAWGDAIIRSLRPNGLRAQRPYFLSFYHRQNTL